MRPVPGNGLHVALLGIDGIGKSTLAAEIVRLCTDRGHAAMTTSWRRSLDEPGEERSSFPQQSLQNLYLETFRLFCGGAVIDGGARTFPDSYAQFAADGGGAGLDGAAITGVRASGPLAAVLLEVAGNVLFHWEVVRPLVAAGHVVVEESYGYKHVVKDLLYAGRTAPEEAAELQLVHSFAREFFGRAMRPDVGLHLAGDPALAMAWRTSQAGATGLFEALPEAGTGDGPGRSFLDMQTGCAREFERFAAAFDWPRVDQDDAPAAENHARAVAALAGTPLGGLLQCDTSLAGGGL